MTGVGGGMSISKRETLFLRCETEVEVSSSSLLDGHISGTGLLVLKF